MKKTRKIITESVQGLSLIAPKKKPQIPCKVPKTAPGKVPQENSKKK